MGLAAAGHAHGHAVEPLAFALDFRGDAQRLAVRKLVYDHIIPPVAFSLNLLLNGTHF